MFNTNYVTRPGQVRYNQPQSNVYNNQQFRPNQQNQTNIYHATNNMAGRVATQIPQNNHLAVQPQVARPQYARSYNTTTNPIRPTVPIQHPNGLQGNANTYRHNAYMGNPGTMYEYKTNSRNNEASRQYGNIPYSSQHGSQNVNQSVTYNVTNTVSSARSSWPNQSLCSTVHESDSSMPTVAVSTSAIHGHRPSMCPTVHGSDSSMPTVAVSTSAIHAHRPSMCPTVHESDSSMPTLAVSASAIHGQRPLLHGKSNNSSLLVNQSNPGVYPQNNPIPHTSQIVSQTQSVRITATPPNTGLCTSEDAQSVRITATPPNSELCTSYDESRDRNELTSRTNDTVSSDDEDKLFQDFLKLNGEMWLEALGEWLDANNTYKQKSSTENHNETDIISETAKQVSTSVTGSQNIVMENPNLSQLVVGTGTVSENPVKITHHNTAECSSACETTSSSEHQKESSESGCQTPSATAIIEENPRFRRLLGQDDTLYATLHKKSPSPVVIDLEDSDTEDCPGSAADLASQIANSVNNIHAKSDKKKQIMEETNSNVEPSCGMSTGQNDDANQEMPIHVNKTPSISERVKYITNDEQGIADGKDNEKDVNKCKENVTTPGDSDSLYEPRSPSKIPGVEASGENGTDTVGIPVEESDMEEENMPEQRQETPNLEQMMNSLSDGLSNFSVQVQQDSGIGNILHLSPNKNGDLKTAQMNNATKEPSSKKRKHNVISVNALARLLNKEGKETQKNMDTLYFRSPREKTTVQVSATASVNEPMMVANPTTCMASVTSTLPQPDITSPSITSVAQPHNLLDQIEKNADNEQINGLQKTAFAASANRASASCVTASIPNPSQTQPKVACLFKSILLAPVCVCSVVPVRNPVNSLISNCVPLASRSLDSAAPAPLVTLSPASTAPHMQVAVSCAVPVPGTIIQTSNQSIITNHVMGNRPPIALNTVTDMARSNANVVTSYSDRPFVTGQAVPSLRPMEVATPSVDPSTFGHVLYLSTSKIGSVEVMVKHPGTKICKEQNDINIPGIVWTVIPTYKASIPSCPDPNFAAVTSDSRTGRIVALLAGFKSKEHGQKWFNTVQKGHN